MDAAAVSGSITLSKHQIGLNVECEQSNAGRDGRTRLARPNSLGANGDREIFYFPCLADREQDWQLHPLDPSFAVCDEHIYIHVSPLYFLDSITHL